MRSYPHPGEKTCTKLHDAQLPRTPREKTRTKLHDAPTPRKGTCTELHDQSCHRLSGSRTYEPPWFCGSRALRVRSCPCPAECGHDVRSADKSLAKSAELRVRCDGKASAVPACVTLPRPVYPATTYMLTRRCMHRQFLMRPDPEIVNAFIYCLAVAAQRFGIDVIDFIQLSNHMHEAIYDRFGNAPQFYEYFHVLLAKCVNAFRGRWENVFSSGQPGVVTLVTTEDLLDRLVYIATNAVKHDLVARVDEWPGASGYRALLNETPLHATRPKFFFSERGKMPKEVTLQVGIPPELGDRDVILDELKKRVESYERKKAVERARTGSKVLGRAAVLRQRWDASPASREPRRKLQRTIGAACKWTRINELARRRSFTIAHREARAAMIAGRPIRFPFGTYWLRRFAGVEVRASQFLG